MGGGEEGQYLARNSDTMWLLLLTYWIGVPDIRDGSRSRELQTNHVLVN